MNSNWPISCRQEFFQAADNGFLMAVFDDIFDSLLPDQLTHPGLESAYRRKAQHCFGLVLPLCMLVLQGQVGQAGVGAIDQVQVSNDSPVPQNAGHWPLSSPRPRGPLSLGLSSESRNARQLRSCA